MALDFSALEAELARDAAVNSSASMLLSKLAAEIETNKDNPVKLQAIVDGLKAHNDSLVASVVANTPAEVPPVEPPPA